MSKILIGILAGVIMTVPVTALAASNHAKKIMHFDTENGSVSVFDDAGNKCYVASRDKSFANQWGSASVSISCVRMK
jgi:hypothetical protein